MTSLDRKKIAVGVFARLAAALTVASVLAVLFASAWNSVVLSIGRVSLQSRFGDRLLQSLSVFRSRQLVRIAGVHIGDCI